MSTVAFEDIEPCYFPDCMCAFCERDFDAIRNASIVWQDAEK